MALNPATEFVGRIIAATTAYPYGSSKNESTPGAGDGTPYRKVRADDIFGFQQALLKSRAIVPSGNADEVRDSQYLQAVVEIAAGSADFYTDSGVADAYVLDVANADSQGPEKLFDGVRLRFVVANVGTGGATTVNPAGLGVTPVKTEAGTDPVAGQMSGFIELRYDATAAAFILTKDPMFRVFTSKTEAVAYIDSFGIVNGAEYIITSADGNTFKGVTGAPASTYSDNGGTSCGSVFIPTAGDGSAALKLANSEEIYPQAFGAELDGVADDSAALVLADAAAEGSKIVITHGTVRISTDMELGSIVAFRGDAAMTTDSGITTTIRVEAGYKQVLYGSGTYVVPFGIPEWFGAKDVNDSGGPVSSSAALAKCCDSCAVVEFPQTYYISELFQPRSGLVLFSKSHRKPSIEIDHAVVPFTGNLGFSSWNGVGTDPDDTGGGAVNSGYLILENLWMKVSNVTNTSFVAKYMHLLETSAVNNCRVRLYTSSIATGLVLAKGPYRSSGCDVLGTSVTYASNPVIILGSAGLCVDTFNYAPGDLAGQLPLYLYGSDGCSYRTFNVESRSLTATDPSVHFVPIGSCSFKDSVLSTKVTDAVAVELDLSFAVASNQNYAMENIRFRKHASAGSGNFTQPVKMTFAVSGGAYDFDLAYMNAAGSTTAQEILGISKFTRHTQEFICKTSSYMNAGMKQDYTQGVGSVVSAGTFDVPIHPFFRSGSNYAATLEITISARDPSGAASSKYIANFGSVGGSDYGPAGTAMFGGTRWGMSAFDHANQKYTFTNNTGATCTDVIYSVSLIHSRNNHLV